MARAPDISESFLADTPSSNHVKRSWKEDRIDIYSSLLGRGLASASTARYDSGQRTDSPPKSPQESRNAPHQNSLKRVQNSHEVLRQRSTQKGNRERADATPPTREGRHFTVANVGNNGKIYLRPSVRPPQPHQTPSPTYPPDTWIDGHTQGSDAEKPNEKKHWSYTQASVTPTRRPQVRTIDPRVRRSNSISGRSTVPSRDSLSTIGPCDKTDPGAYKVIIKNGIAQPLPAENPPLGQIDINIPHYRLGTPRFSTRGTAFLNSGVYSSSSAADDADIPPGETPQPEYGNLLPLLSDPKILTTNPVETKELPPIPKTVPMRMPITTMAPVFHKAREPIVPAIYEAIAANPDDPSIVRYAMTTREISAASPARIIAQVTSKSFLDYELLSDFFLTVRAYLPTSDLLEYLMARFEWAINRFDDEGRVIRVRSFAAIRHWVLNYFPYDFVVDRELRVRFCDRLNALARHVRRNGHEASDFKLIIDLKKCWNGRCALYWDNIYDDSEGRIEHDISPGGIVGSRDSQLTHPNELWAKLASSTHQVDQEKSVAALHNWVDSVIEAEVDGKSKTDRQGSVSSPTHPQSLLSEQSTVQVNSCSVPGKTFKAAAQAGRNPGPHPVPALISLAARRVCPAAPSAQSKDRMVRTKGDHQRSGSFSDALRDKRTSLGAIQEGKTTEPVVMSLPFSGSLVRGSVFPPGSPFIDNLTQYGSGSSMKKQGQYVGDQGEKMAERPMSPGVRNLLSNLRRAWSKQQISSSAVTPTPNLIPPAPFVLEAKHSGLPMHIAYKIEGFGDQHHQLEALKKNARIDLLCADVTDMFERAIPPDGQAVSAKPSSTRLTHKSDPDRHSPDSWQHVPSPRDKLQRNHSEFTIGSRSIVIMDDTSSEPPVPSIPAPYNKSAPPYETATQLLTTGHPIMPTRTEYQQRKPLDQDEGEAPQSNLIPEFARPYTAARQQSQRRPSYTIAASYRSERSGSVSLRKFASFQSGMGKQSGETTRTSGAAEKAEKPAGKLLRRRPGGDLRANGNVHDMEPRPRRGSTGSIAAFSESMCDSIMDLERVSANAPKPPSSGSVGRASTPVPRRSISLVNPRTSHKEKLRPSFELAVAEFARIPDDERGDLETTLMKLEGKFRKSPIGSSDGNRSAGARNAQQPPQQQASQVRPPQPQVAEKEIGSSESLLTPPASSRGPDHSDHGSPSTTSKAGANTANRSLYAASEDSYNPVPLVERGGGLAEKHAQGSQVKSGEWNQSTVTVPRPLFSFGPLPDQNGSVISDRTSELDSMTRVRRGRCRSSIPTMTTDSFLLDEDESLSDISSDFSEGDDEDAANSLIEDAYGSEAHSMQPPPGIPANSAYACGYLPSPPMTTENDVSISSEARKQQEGRTPPTPEPSPVSRMTEMSTKSRTPNEVDVGVLQPFANKLHRFPPRRHLPFVLAFDAEVLAQQLTLIERDALNEINWQDLIDLKWQTTPSPALNWVEYLRFQDPNGIDLVIARANLMVKWALSEIVLTYNAEERALTIMKFIRVAQHARRYHNYATLLQLTLALTSLDCTRLTKTWSHVPEVERAAMKEMEALVSPIRNFHNMRAEMDAANLEDGCIPVVALFLHDLTYNAQKPSLIASTRDAEPLINFERYRTTARIVKSLLRLVDASAKYDFKPVEGALERCLWVASLSDDGIRNRSKEIEPASESKGGR